MKYKVDQTIWHIKIDKYKDPNPYNFSYRESGIKVKELKILGISEHKIVFNDSYFTTVANDDKEGYRKDRSLYGYLDDISVNIRVSNHILGDGVFISLYSTKKPAKKLLDKMVARASVEIDDKYGFLMKSVVNELWEIIDDYKNKG